MRVLNVVDGSGWTGGVEQALILSRALRERGVDAVMAVHGGNPVLAEAAVQGVPVFAYDEGKGVIGRMGRLKSLLDEGYDVTVGHKPGAVRHLLLPRALSRRGGLFIGVRRVSYPLSALTVYRAVHHVVAVAEHVRKVLVESGIGADRITVIPSGVDTDSFRPSEEMRRSARADLGLGDGVVLLNLAKFVPRQKGQRHLFDALRRVLEGMKVTLLLAGLETDGEEARAMVREYGLGKVVRLLGFRRDIPRLINAADLFVFPSLPGLDAIAGSVLQSMACGKPTVATSVGGIPEYVRDGDNGFLVEPGDSAGLAAAIVRALRLGKREREDLGRRARETVTRGYSTAAMAESWIGLLRVLMEKGGKGNAPPGGGA